MYLNNLNKFTLLILTCICISSCYHSQKNEQAENAISVDIVFAEDRKLDNTLNSFGTISYKSKNDITSLVSGTIENSFAKEGEQVTKGKILAKLRNVQLELQKEQALSNLNSAKARLLVAKSNHRAAILSAESRFLAIEKSELNIFQKESELKLLKQTFDKKTQLHEIGGVTDSSLEQLQMQVNSLQTEIAILKNEQESLRLGFRDSDLVLSGLSNFKTKDEKNQWLIKLNTQSSEAELESAKAQVEISEQQLHSVNKLIDELTIRSPVNGIVGVRYFENGEYVKENEKIMSIIDTSSVYGVINIQEKDIVNFEIGSLLSIHINSLNKNYESNIAEISPIADSKSGNFTVKTSIENPSGKIKPGMFIKCSLQKQEERKLPCLPDSVLVNSSGTNGKIFCVVNNHLVQKSIIIEEQKNGFIWISKNSISKTDAVVKNPSSFLKEGQKVIRNEQ